MGRSQLNGTESWLVRVDAGGYFSSVTEAMITLLFNGTLLASVDLVHKDIRDENAFLAGVFLLHIFLTNCAVLNMLIGLMCGVVGEVQMNESERKAKVSLTARLLDIMTVYDKSDSHS